MAESVVHQLLDALNIVIQQSKCCIARVAEYCAYLAGDVVVVYVHLAPDRSAVAATRRTTPALLQQQSIELFKSDSVFTPDIAPPMEKGVGCVTPFSPFTAQQSVARTTVRVVRAAPWNELHKWFGFLTSEAGLHPLIIAFHQRRITGMEVTE
jgi:hypothetical protein